MTSSQDISIDVLNAVYAAERSSLVPRLAESSLFFAWGDARQLAQVQRIIAEQQEHQAWLFEAIDRLDGSVYPSTPNAMSANLHYLDLTAVLPEVVADVDRRLERLTAAANTPNLAHVAVDTLSRMQSRMQQHLVALTQLRDRIASAQPTA